MIKRTFLILSIALLCCAAEPAAIGVQFEGKPPSNAGLIKKRLQSENDPTFYLLDSLTNGLVEQGFLNAAITIKDGQIIISSGNRYFVSKINFIEDSSYTRNANVSFDSAAVTAAIEGHLQLYHGAGYLYATASTEKVELQDTSVVLTVKIIKGPQVEYGGPKFTGLKRTDSKLIERYLPENSDGLVSSQFISEVTRAAEQLKFVNFKAPLSVQPRPGYTVSDLVLNFIEKTPVRFEGAAGINGSENSELVWSFDLTLNNMFGQGKRAGIRSERPDSRRNKLSVDYSQPLFLLGLGELVLNVNTRDYRDEFYEFALGAGYRTRINREFETGLNFEWKSSKPEFGTAAYNRYTGQFSVIRRTFTNDFNPEKGLLTEWGIDFIFRKYNSTAIQSRTFNETRNSLCSKLYQPLIGRIQLHSSLNYKGLETGEDLPPLSELILIGGPGTIRGYRNEQFAVIRAAFGTIEPRLRFSQSYISLFYEAVYLNNRALNNSNTVITVEQFKWSYGLGLGFGNGRRSVLLSFGVNPELGIGEPRMSIEISSDI